MKHEQLHNAQIIASTVDRVVTMFCSNLENLVSRMGRR
jgi:hypothetical protein